MTILRVTENAEPRAPRVLIVDDEESVRTLIARMLGSAGYDVYMAADGPETLSIVEARGQFDVYLIDMTMPGMSGTELGRRLRLARPETRVLYCTGHSDRLFEEKTTLWQKEAFIDKPVSARALREAVSMILFGHTRGPGPKGQQA